MRPPDRADVNAEITVCKYHAIDMAMLLAILIGTRTQTDVRRMSDLRSRRLNIPRYSPSKHNWNPLLVFLRDHKCKSWGNEAVYGLLEKIADGQSQIDRTGELDSQNRHDSEPNSIDGSDSVINLFSGE
jgi:hypothetical protein